MLIDAAFRSVPCREAFPPNCRTRAPSQSAHSAISGAAKVDFRGRRTAIACWSAYNGYFGAAVWRKRLLDGITFRSQGGAPSGRPKIIGRWEVTWGVILIALTICLFRKLLYVYSRKAGSSSTERRYARRSSLSTQKGVSTDCFISNCKSTD